MALSTDMKIAMIRRKTRLVLADKENNFETLEEAVNEVRALIPEYFEGFTDDDIVKAFEGFQETL